MFESARTLFIWVNCPTAMPSLDWHEAPPTGSRSACEASRSLTTCKPIGKSSQRGHLVTVFDRGEVEKKKCNAAHVI